MRVFTLLCMLLLILPLVHGLSGASIAQEFENTSQTRVLVTVKQTEEQKGFSLFGPPKDPYERFLNRMRPSPITAFVSMLSDDDPYRVVKKLESLDLMILEVNEKGFDMVLDNPYTQEVNSDKEVHAFLNESGPLVGTEIINRTPYKDTQIDGGNDSVCVIDSGVATNHTALQGEVVAEKCFCYPDCCPDGTAEDDSAIDDNGHGTHVAGIIASQDETYPGISQSTNIVAVKALDENGTGTTGDILIALDWCSNISRQESYNISVISMSLGEGSYEGSCDGTNDLADAANDAVTRGVFVAAATGNNGYDSAVATPACASKVFSVGATYDENLTREDYESCTDTDPSKDMLTCFTNIDTSEAGHPAPDILAPGAKITSPVPTDTCTGGSSVSHCDGSGYNTLKGTSMATPHVAAAATMVIQMFELAHNRSPTPKEIGHELNHSAHMVNTTRVEKDFSRLDLNTSVLGIENDPPSVNYTPPTPSDGETVSSLPVPINATVNDQLHGIDSCIFKWTNPDGENKTEDMNTSDTCTLSFMPDGEGNFSFTVLANDTVGNTGHTPERTINVSNGAPTLDTIDPSSPSITMEENTSQSFAVTASDPNNDTLTGTFYLDNVSVLSKTMADNSLSWTLHANWTMAGEHTVTVVVSDGGLSDMWRWNVTITDKNAPLMKTGEMSDVWWYMRPNSIKNHTMANISGVVKDFDGDMNCSMQTHENVSVDNINGTLNLSSPANWTGLVNATLTCQDNISQVNDTFHIWVTQDYDEDGHGHPFFGGDDCNDTNPIKWTGKSCERDCYSGSTYNTECECSGGTYTCDSDSDDGGSSGGGGAPIHRTPVSTAYHDRVEEDHRYVHIVREEDIPIERYTFKMAESKTGGSLTVRDTDTQGCYASFEVTHPFDDDSMEEATFTFPVNRSYAETYDRISLFRREDGWNELETKKVGERDETVVYEAISPGFSLFMIRGIEETEPENDTQANTTTPQDNRSTPENTTNTTGKETNETAGNTTRHTMNTTQPTGEEIAPREEHPSYIVVSPKKLVVWGVIVFITALSVTLFVFRPEKTYNPRALERYISHRLSIGHKEDTIKKDLNELGWKEEHIRKHTEEAKFLHKLYRLEQYIQKRLMLGHIEEEIEKELKQYGWHPHHVQKAKSRAKKKHAQSLEHRSDHSHHAK